MIQVSGVLSVVRMVQMTMACIIVKALKRRCGDEDGEKWKMKRSSRIFRNV